MLEYLTGNPYACLHDVMSAGPCSPQFAAGPDISWTWPLIIVALLFLASLSFARVALTKRLP
jgi:hypothetical protein